MDCISAQLLPLTTLCIAPQRSVWCLYVDATCINYDGNVFDAALLAMVAALRNSEPGLHGTYCSLTTPSKTLSLV